MLATGVGLDPKTDLEGPIGAEDEPVKGPGGPTGPVGTPEGTGHPKMRCMASKFP